MRVGNSSSAILGLIVLLTLCGVSHADEHAQVSRIYTRVKAVFAAPPGARIEPVEIDGKVVCGAAKMWAVKADRTGREISGPVNIGLHDWEPNDHLYLYFESATPMLVHLYQIYPETGHPMAGQKRVVLPRERFPKSFDALPPGKAVRLPVLLKLDNTRVDESIAVALTALDLKSNVPKTNDVVLDNPPVTKSADAAVGAQGASIVTRMEYAAKLADAGLTNGRQYRIPEGARLAAVALGSGPGRIEPVAPADVGSLGDDFKAVAVFTGQQAFFKLEIHK